MPLKHKLSRIPILRRGVIKALKFFKCDISITNGWTGHMLKINSYHHKNYWYFGRERERETMQFFARLIQEGDTVIEVGGHIGFITQYFSKLVGPRGKVVVFEPGSSNARYLEENVHALHNTTLERAAVSSKNGKATFYEDNVTGQNNSLLSDYKNAETTAKAQGETLVLTPREVDVVTIDSYVAEHGLAPDFLKIDVEGCERDVLLGATETLRSVRALMVEVTLQHEAVTKALHGADFRIFDELGLQHVSILLDGNFFALR